MSLPIIFDANHYINTQDMMNITIATIAMEEMTIAHILNAEGEKSQYILDKLEGSDPGEISIFDIMEVSKSVQKTFRDGIKTEIPFSLNLRDAVLNTRRMERNSNGIWSNV